MDKFKRNIKLKQLKILLIPLIMIIVGAYCNFLVVSLNNGMPIIDNANNYISGSALSFNHTYIDIDTSTKLAFLGDTIKIQNYILSIGDVLVFSGYILYIILVFKIIYKTFSLKVVSKNETYI